MKFLQSFFLKYKVRISGLIAAIIIAVTQLQGTNPTWFAMSMTAVVAASTWFANNIRGQWQTIISAVMVVVINVMQSLHDKVPLNIQELLMYLLAAIGVMFLGISLPPVKNISYEKKN